MPRATPAPVPPPVLEPYWTTTDGQHVRLYHGNVTDVLARLPAKSVHMCVTSPPYWGLRDYGTATWDGGDSECKHKIEVGERSWDAIKPKVGTVCKCGALRIEDNQLGSEPSPACKTDGQAQCGRCHICNIVAVFRGVYRVLRDDGTIWVNYGDSYTGGGGFSPGSPSNQGTGSMSSRQDAGSGVKPVGPKYNGLPGGNLVGIPWRVALALQADGWVLRQDIIWHKPAPMPESVRNRCTKAHEYVFLLAKSAKYFYDAEAIKERVKSELNSMTWEKRKAAGATGGDLEQGISRNHGSGMSHDLGGTNGRSNKRSVWSISSQGYEGAHFATFPPKLIEPMIKAGTSEKGCCAECGAPWKRVVEEKALTRDRPNDFVKRTGDEGTGNSCANSVAGVETKTIGWEPTCECHGTFVKREGTRKGYGSYHAHEEDGVAYGLRQGGRGPASSPGEPTKEFKTTIVKYVSDIPLDEHPVVPCTVLDCFIGSGTTCAVSIDLGRRSVGIDLSEKYLKNNAIPRIEGTLLSRPALARLVGRKRVEMKWSSVVSKK